jgi:hypothetical protein
MHASISEPTRPKGRVGASGETPDMEGMEGGIGCRITAPALVVGLQNSTCGLESHVCPLTVDRRKPRGLALCTVDTLGIVLIPFSFARCPLSFAGGCKIGCYVHYPTISTDMLARVVC